MGWGLQTSGQWNLQKGDWTKCDENVFFVVWTSILLQWVSRASALLLPLTAHYAPHVASPPQGMDGDVVGFWDGRRLLKGSEVLILRSGNSPASPPSPRVGACPTHFFVTRVMKVPFSADTRLGTRMKVVSPKNVPTSRKTATGSSYLTCL